MTIPNKQRQLALELRTKGATYRQIRKALGFDTINKAQYLCMPSKPTMQRLRSRSKGKCELCGDPIQEKGQSCVHHIKIVLHNPQDYNSLSNLTLLCTTCHSAVHNAAKQALKCTQ